MAITKCLHMKQAKTGYPAKHLANGLRYIMNPEKTEHGRYVCGHNCIPEQALSQMVDTKRHFGKLDKRQGYHFILSFEEDEVSEEEAFQVVGEFVTEFLGKDFEAVYAVHNDTDHIHCLLYTSKEVVSVFRTNEEGYLITPEQLKCGTYRIEEVEAPENYVQVGFENALLKDGKEVPLNEVADGGTYQEAKKAPITITVNSDTVHQVEEETGKFIVVIEQYNDEAVGSLTIHKKGEKLSGASKVEEKFLTKMKNGVVGFVNQVSSFFTGEEVMEKEKGYKFDYEEGNMEGAEFAIHAKKTIYTPDG